MRIGMVYCIPFMSPFVRVPRHVAAEPLCTYFYSGVDSDDKIRNRVVHGHTVRLGLRMNVGAARCCWRQFECVCKGGRGKYWEGGNRIIADCRLEDSNNGRRVVVVVVLTEDGFVVKIQMRRSA